jgi:hypothetical protein
MSSDLNRFLLSVRSFHMNNAKNMVLTWGPDCDFIFVE